MASIANLPKSNSLVQYGEAVLVSTSGKSKPKAIKGKKDGKGTNDIENLNNAHTEDILNSILPPREFTSDKQQLWIQSVLSTPATKAEVVALQEELNDRLKQRQSRETGICPIREELYAQCFDELIRQIAINCIERGLLLVRVRDEIRMTIQAYQTLYESSIALGMRKTLQADQKRLDLNGKIKNLEAEVQQLTKEAENYELKIDEINKNELKLQEEEEKAHREEVEFLKKANQRFKDELEKALTGTGASKKKQIKN